MSIHERDGRNLELLECLQTLVGQLVPGSGFAKERSLMSTKACFLIGGAVESRLHMR